MTDLCKAKNPTPVTDGHGRSVEIRCNKKAGHSDNMRECPTCNGTGQSPGEGYDHGSAVWGEEWANTEPRTLL